jgi:CRISPR system Cascade subunit CasB
MSDPRYLKFEDPQATAILLAWWQGLDKHRGERAALRRCRSLTEVAFVPSFHHLLRELSQCSSVNAEGLALVAGLASHLKSNSPRSGIAEQMAKSKKPGGSAALSGLRFRRLLKVQAREDLYPALVRVIALLGGAVNLVSLAKSAYEWNDWTRKQWAFDYYSTAPAET